MTTTIRVEDLEAALTRYEEALRSRAANTCTLTMEGVAEFYAPVDAARREAESALSAAYAGGVGISVPSSSGSGRYLVRFVGRPDDDEVVSLWECSCSSRSTCKHIRRAANAIHDIGDALGYE